MTDLSRFSDESFDLIFHPVSNIFSPEILPMWQECFRVLKPGGALLAGFNNPVAYIFDEAAEDAGELVVRHKLPYSDLTSLNQEELDRVLASGRPLEFCHTLEDQIGGQIAAGFHIVGFFEDGYPGRLLDAHTPLFIATRALKP
jgi:SAM-dependent methyltransferase